MERSTVDWSGILGDCGSGNVGNRSWRDESSDAKPYGVYEAISEASDVQEQYKQIHTRLKIALWIIGGLALMLCVLAGWVLFEVAR